MKRTVLAVGLASLGGCAAVPPMYPVFDAASDTKTSSPFVMRETLPEEPAKDGAARSPSGWSPSRICPGRCPNSMSSARPTRIRPTGRRRRSIRLATASWSALSSARSGHREQCGDGGVRRGHRHRVRVDGLALRSGGAAQYLQRWRAQGILHHHHGDGVRRTGRTAGSGGRRDRSAEQGRRQCRAARRRRRPVPGPQPARTVVAAADQSGGGDRAVQGLLAVPDAKGIMETQALSAEENRAGSMCW